MIEDDRVQSLVILNLNLEVDTSISQELFSKEPVLRDNIMTTLVKLSSGGRTLNSITDVDNYETLRAMILTNLQNEIPNGIHNVLILDMARQDL
jgi:flagellar basal body-associated protein FliL